MSDQALATLIPPAGDQDLEIHLAARSTEEMTQCQTKLRDWLTAKIRSCRHDFNELKQATDIAVERKWGSSTLKRHAALAKQRLVFYGKVLAAVEAGYTIVPNFPIDIFAVRVNKAAPAVRRYYEDRAWRSTVDVPDVEVKALPSGEGHYVSDEPRGRTSTETIKQPDGKSDLIRTWFKVTSYGEVEFPVACARPVVMEATAQAMATKVFDAIGICPAKATRKDPLIIGQVHRKRQGWAGPQVVSFLIAWHLDLRTL